MKEQEAYFYTVYYISSFCSGSLTFSRNSSYHIVPAEGIAGIKIYLFSISVTVKIRNILYEGEKSPFIQQGNKNYSKSKFYHKI